MYEFKSFLTERLHRLDEWIVRNGWKGYDPFDGLNARLIDRLAFGNHYLRIALQQSVRRFPVNVRPLLGIQKETSTKGMGFCALGYLKLFQATTDEGYLKKMRFCLDWVRLHFSEGYSGHAWGNHFDYESRGGRIPLNVPTIVWTSLIGNAFMEAYEVLNEPIYFHIAKSAGDFIVKDIPRYSDSDGTICFMYTPQKAVPPSLDGCIHNANTLGAWLLARIYKHTKEENLYSLAKKAMAFTVKHQTTEGAWDYGVAKKYGWVDSFHTGYVLESLHGFSEAIGDRSFEESLFRGFKYFKTVFFKEDGTPNYYSYKTYPIDIQCASQGIQTLVNLRKLDATSIEAAQKVAVWTVTHMQDRKGCFHFRKYPYIANKTPMFHWGQATMLSALGHLLLNI